MDTQPRSPRPRVAADGPLDPTVLALLGDRVELLPWEATAGPILPVDGLYTYGHPAVDAEMLDRLPGLRVVSNYGVGIDHIDMAAASARGIPVGNTPGVLDGATADLAFALLLAASRRVVEGDRYARSPAFTSYDPGSMLGREVHGSTLGIVGLGRIGEKVARRAIGFDMAVCYQNRNPRPEVEAALGLRYSSFEQLLAESDFVVLCVPLTDRTRGLIDANALGRMKPTAVLVNVSRGPVVVTDDLLAALRSGTIAAAGLDVTDPEPLPRDHGLLAMDNLVLTPHLGSATDRTRRRMAELSVANLLAGLDGLPLPSPVPPTALGSP
ncbi:2-hydroxyacid dehydrogenase [Tautonia sociabilis]|uniref:D-glycerate dehydrogenase n=1 Tax=Tautonia sociabilis TaxID=2080755 RepID=A0A432MJN3_9BACT|nr:D-glycerate dehydrogenase [Tautonia sociabilis]RUL87622.1 D-glycerate dehydrogenase [Tautonia sociabilis]